MKILYRALDGHGSHILLKRKCKLGTQGNEGIQILKRSSWGMVRPSLRC